jgi:RNA polymerase sigma factor (sigma-70 family)
MTDQEIKFTQIVRQTKASVLSAISKTLHPDFFDSIDDVVQETYLRAYNSLKKEQFRYESSLNTWIYTIARNEALRANKKLMKKNSIEQHLEEKHIGTIPSVNRTDSEIQSKDNNEILNKLLGQLPIKYKSVLELDISGLKDWQIAEKLQISIGTVKSRNSRAREKVKQWIHQMKLT